MLVHDVVISFGPTFAPAKLVGGGVQWTTQESKGGEKAQESKIVLTGAGSVEGKVIELKTKSVYTKDEILFRFEWPDKDKSMEKNAWKFSGGKWNKIKANEDRLGLVFEINRIDKFATKGEEVALLKQHELSIFDGH